MSEAGKKVHKATRSYKEKVATFHKVAGELETLRKEAQAATNGAIAEAPTAIEATTGGNAA